jgi:predicted TIM-barrel fold metal-dependent hydrolase
MKMVDEIIREVWQAKDALAKEFNYDIRAFAADLQMRQRHSGRKTVNLAEFATKPTADEPQARPIV